METYRILSRETYPRCAHLDYFCTWPSPMQGSRYQWTSQPSTRRWRRGRCLSSSPSYCAARAANGVPELRQRLRGEEILEYDHCPTSHTVALEDGTPLLLHPAQ